MGSLLVGLPIIILIRPLFSGKVERIRFDVKTNMTITVSGKEYQIAHQWPLLQKYVKVGDSVIKRAKESNVILIKADTKERIICSYK